MTTTATPVSAPIPECARERDRGAATASPSAPPSTSGSPSAPPPRARGTSRAKATPRCRTARRRRPSSRARPPTSPSSDLSTNALLMIPSPGIGQGSSDVGEQASSARWLVVVRRAGLRRRRSLPVAGEHHDRAAVGRSSDVARQRLGRRPERDLAPVQTQNEVPGPRLLHVVRRDQHAAAFSGESSISAISARRFARRRPRTARRAAARPRPGRARAPPERAGADRPRARRTPVGQVLEADHASAASARSRSARPGRRHHGSRASVPISATSSALTG